MNVGKSIVTVPQQSIHACAQVSGHIYDEEGRKVLALSGAWNSHLDMVKCDEEGDPLPDAKTTRLWQVLPCHPLSSCDK